MKTFIKILLFAMLPFPGFAQYVPNSAQNFHYASLYNPAFTGIENFVDLKVGYRYQWTGFKDQAPKFANIAANIRVKQPLDMKLNALRPSRPDFAKILPKSKLSIQGLGINAFNESVGPVKTSGAGVHYALHFPVAKDAYVSGGIGAMIENSKVDASQLYWGPNPDAGDPVYDNVMAGGANHTELWTRIGLLFYTETFYFGATYYPWNTTIKKSDVIAFNDPYYHGGFQTGMSFPLNEDFTLKPSIWALWNTTQKWTVDYGAKFYMQDKTWFGLTYRSVKSGVVSAGLNVNQLLSASYCYEFSLGKLRTFGGGSHELVIALRLNNFKKLNQRTW